MTLAITSGIPESDAVRPGVLLVLWSRSVGVPGDATARFIR
jgi:hypothetical protein